MTTTINVGGQTKVLGQICRCRFVQASVCKDTQPELDPLRYSQPMKIAKQRRYVFGLPRREDQACGGVQNGLQLVESNSRNASKNRVAVIDFADHKSTNQGQQGVSR